jgi:hypothetical protein
MGIRISTVRRLALALPEVTEGPHFNMEGFRVNKKLIATVPPEADRVHVFVEADEVAAYCAEYPDAVEELWWGERLSGCRVILAQADAVVMGELLALAWRRRAPKRLLRS